MHIKLLPCTLGPVVVSFKFYKHVSNHTLARLYSAESKMAAGQNIILTNMLSSGLRWIRRFINSLYSKVCRAFTKLDNCVCAHNSQETEFNYSYLLYEKLDMLLFVYLHLTIF